MKLEGFDKHTNVYIGEYNSDEPEQHFKRLRSHKTTQNNPDYMFITHNISKKYLDRAIRKLYFLRSIGCRIDIKIPEQYKEIVKLVLSRKRAELTVERLKIAIEEQKKVVYDGEIVLKSNDLKVARIVKPYIYATVTRGRPQTTSYLSE